MLGSLHIPFGHRVLLYAGEVHVKAGRPGQQRVASTSVVAWAAMASASCSSQFAPLATLLLPASAAGLIS